MLEDLEQVAKGGFLVVKCLRGPFSLGRSSLSLPLSLIHQIGSFEQIGTFGEESWWVSITRKGILSSIEKSEMIPC